MFEPTIAEQFTGSGRPTLLRAVRASYGSAGAAAGVAEGVPIGRAYVVEEAFRRQAYTPDLAIVDVAGPGRGGAPCASRHGCRWCGGTKTGGRSPRPGGDWTRSSAPVTDLTGYILFPDRG
ncbi:hypothetical protein [Microbispora rosea]|uniref:hypothetical protein n=1 Tax=Microbispora rosea TaxID=58117 RepID=UPI00117BEDF8|nr:hypothetical protein [Microbispora rosea]